MVDIYVTSVSDTNLPCDFKYILFHLLIFLCCCVKGVWEEKTWFLRIPSTLKILGQCFTSLFLFFAKRENEKLALRRNLISHSYLESNINVLKLELVALLNKQCSKVNIVTNVWTLPLSSSLTPWVNTQSSSHGSHVASVSHWLSSYLHQITIFKNYSLCNH